MRDAFLIIGFRVAVLAMICVAALLGLSLSYQAFCDVLRGAWPDAALMLGVSAVAGIGVKWLCDHRGELIEA